MTNLIDNTYFKGQLLIANSSESTYVHAFLDGVITQLQYDFLQALLGPQLYAQFETWYAVQPLDQNNPFYKLLKGDTFTYNSRPCRWIGLAPTVLLSPIANYVYYHYQRDNATQTVSMGEVKTDSEHAQPAAPGLKMATAWNAMVDMLGAFVPFMDNYYPDNEDWIYQRSQLYNPFNAACYFSVYLPGTSFKSRDLFIKTNTWGL